MNSMIPTLVNSLAKRKSIQWIKKKKNKKKKNKKKLLWAPIMQD